MGFLLRKLPLNFALWLGGCLGKAGYYLRKKRRRIAYVNLKAAFGNQKSPRELIRINKNAFQNLGRNLIEVFLFPRIDKRYIDKYVQIEGMEEIDKALTAGKGVIFLTAHFGNWELSSLVAAIKGYPLKVLARQQKFPRLNRLLISYREVKGCRVISKGMAIRDIIKSLRNNEIVGVLADQDAGAKGVFIKFFGREASTAGGAIRIALGEKSKVLPAFIIREKGPEHRIVIKPPLNLEKTADLESNVGAGLQEFTSCLENFISGYPSQWLWQHKRWKSAPSRSIIILSDNKAGHVNQSKAVAKAIEKVYKLPSAITSKVMEVEFKNKFARDLPLGCAAFASPNCQGCMSCLRFCLKRESYEKLIAAHGDIIISTGRSLCAINLILAKENCAKSIVLMKPPSFLINRFDLVIAPEHDNLKSRANVLKTLAAPNLIDPEYLKEQAEKLKDSQSFRPESENIENRLRIGVLIGGDNPYFKLSKDLMERAIEAILTASSELNAEILLTTSRRTPEEIDNLLRQKLGHFQLCKLLVIANENNIEGAVSGILGLSQVVVVSGESISMLSEAVASGKYVLAFKLEDKVGQKSDRHERFLDNLIARGFITLVQVENLAEAIKKVCIERPALKLLDDNQRICQAVRKLL